VKGALRATGATGLAWRVAILLAAHALLLRWMAEKDTVAVIFAPGPHVPRAELLTAAAFIAVRLATVLLVPGYLSVAALRLSLRHRTPVPREERETRHL
jgi:hypothetical protein